MLDIASLNQFYCSGHRELIENLNEEMNITVVLVEQKLPFARKLGSNFVDLDRGRLAAKGRMDKLTEDTVKNIPDSVKFKSKQK